jgi:FKBP-type peptidyl-prolyl cis-trans isomerase
MVGVIGLCSIALNAGAEEPPKTLNSEQDKISYSLGYNIGKRLQQQKLELNQDILQQGMRDALGGGAGLLTDQEVETTLRNLQRSLAQKAADDKKKAGEKNAADGEKFLADNAGKTGVVKLPSGLQYKIVKEGSGKKPSANDKVSTHYRGTLIDGTEFDSSYARGKPATFPVNGVIAGWTEALQLMPEGAKWQLFVPAKLAYGEEGMGDRIGPNSTLLFEVELIKVE